MQTNVHTSVNNTRLALELTWHAVTWMANRISGNCLTNGEGCCLGKSLVAMIEKTLRHRRPLNAYVFFLIHYVYSHNGLYVLCLHPFKCKLQCQVLNLWRVCPVRHANNKLWLTLLNFCSKCIICFIIWQHSDIINRSDHNWACLSRYL